MLTEQGIVSADDARLLRAGLDRIDEDQVRTVTYDGTYEDLFFYLEQRSSTSAAMRSPAGCTPRAAATTST